MENEIRRIGDETFSYLKSDKGSKRLRSFFKTFLQPPPSVIELIQMKPKQQAKALKRYKKQNQKSARKFLKVVQGAA